MARDKRGKPLPRVCYLPAPHYFNLNAACMVVQEAFGGATYAGCFLVGSSLVRRDYRDVDVRCIVDDEHFKKLFGCDPGTSYLNPLWSLMCSSISMWLSKQSGLPVDFQIQQMTHANANNPKGKRRSIGMFLNPNPADFSQAASEEGSA